MTSSSCSKVASSPSGGDVADGKWFFVSGDRNLVKVTEPSKDSLLLNNASLAVKAKAADLSTPLGDRQLTLSSKAMREAVRHMHVKSGRLGHTGKHSSGANVFRGGVVAPLVVQTNGSGVYNIIMGDALFAASTDYASFSALFDISRVTSVSLMYRPRGGGANPLITSTTFGTHVPMAVAFDPEALAPSSWSTLSSSRDWTQTHINSFTSTDVKLTHHFPTSSGKKVMADNGSATNPALGQWVDNLSYSAGRVDGGVLLAVYPDPLNVSTILGSLFVVFETEWSYRL